MTYDLSGLIKLALFSYTLLAGIVFGLVVVAWLLWRKLECVVESHDMALTRIGWELHAENPLSLRNLLNELHSQAVVHQQLLAEQEKARQEREQILLNAMDALLLFALTELNKKPRTGKSA